MKIPVVNKYFFVNILIYTFIIMSFSYIISLNSFIGNNLAYIWIIFVIFAILTDLITPFAIILALLEFILFKLKILKYKQLEANVHPKVQKLIYVLAALSFVYYLWYKFYFEPILEKMLEFD